jgi:spore maturation protein CgeB
MLADTLPMVGRECGFEHNWFDEKEFTTPKSAIYFHKAFRRLSGRRPPGYWRLNRKFLEAARAYGPDVVLVVSGKHLSPATIRSIKASTGAALANYATDDPFNTAVSTPMFRRSIPYYDFYACTKTAIIADVQSAGCRNAVYVPFGYKPDHHFPEQASTAEEHERFDTDVAFVGGCDDDRLPIISAIPSAQPGLRLNLFGWFWDRHAATRPYFRGRAWGREVRLAFSGAKIVVNLVRRANRDSHGPRTFEIPACGGFMLTDRTDEQCSLLAEDKEAVYFSSTEEMVDKIRYYLGHDSQRRQIAQAGYRSITSEKHTYADRLKTIIETIQGGSVPAELSAP